MNSPSDFKVYSFTWQLPANIESVDLSYFEFQLDQQAPIILKNNSIILPLSYGEHNVSVVAVDWCDRKGQASFLQVNIQIGEWGKLIFYGTEYCTYKLFSLSLSVYFRRTWCDIQ